MKDNADDLDYVALMRDKVLTGEARELPEGVDLVVDSIPLEPFEDDMDYYEYDDPPEVDYDDLNRQEMITDQLLDVIKDYLEFGTVTELWKLIAEIL